MAVEDKYTFHSPVDIGQLVWCRGETYVVESIIFGRKGIQRIFSKNRARGESLNFKPRDIGVGVFLEPPENPDK